LPAIEPDASKTIIASSVHGVGLSSAPGAVADPARSAAKPSATAHTERDGMFIP
jgi:hypothetical protein